MRNLLLIIFITVFAKSSFAQFTYSGDFYNADGSGASGVPVKVYRRTNSTITGFTSQTNYNGHSYYRSTSSERWTVAKANCEAMGGHLATVSSSGENNFLYSTWPSGWIGLYQDKSGAFYSEPNGGWRWTENQVDDYEHNYDSKNYTTKLVDNINSKDATMYNGPTRYTSGGNYVYFDGSNDYAITGNVAGSFPNGSEVQTLQLLCYPQDPGVLVAELGTGTASSGWHESVMEITTNGTLRVGFWNGSGISSIGTNIVMNQWHLITMTYDGSTLRGYLDGTYFGALTFNRAAPHNYGNGMYYCFGKSDATNMGNGSYAQFRLGSFQIYDRALSADEVMRNWMHISYRYGRMKYTNWNGGEPNNWGGEDYIQFVSSGRWNDLPSTSSLPYVIEFDYIVTTSSWSLYKTIYTDSAGHFSLSESYDPSKEYYLTVDLPQISQALKNSDAQSASQKILGIDPIDGVDYYTYDVNADNSISVSDQYWIFGKKSGIFNSWKVPDLRFFTSSEYNTIKLSSSNMRSTIPGSTSITTSPLVSGGSLTYYLIAAGYAGKIDY
jgi:hypothetical protein